MKNNPEDIARVNNMLTDCVELKLHDVVCIVGADELRLMILTDSVGKRQLSAICDRAVEKELVFRMHKTDCQGRLPEVLCSLMPGLCRDDYALYVYDITDGTYHVHLVNRRTAEETEIRITDAVLLSMVANIPLLTSHAYNQVIVWFHSSLALFLSSYKATQLLSGLQKKYRLLCRVLIKTVVSHAIGWFLSARRAKKNLFVLFSPCFVLSLRPIRT